ncbi:uncharacterized protein LOC132741257 [Ruditapes philippinarum]|uniref:uncharacterized protein LOC132741257 n=1 Tax=Ruditapes philippinarum TaxID=129788 RepID=UPI00295ABD2C|nr:uncharacterized protein LOC132741257 [Ruditapes philippinarum]
MTDSKISQKTTVDPSDESKTQNIDLKTTTQPYSSVTDSKISQKTTMGPCDESKTQNIDFKTTEQPYSTSDGKNADADRSVVNTNNASSSENSTGEDKKGIDSTIYPTPERPHYTRSTESTPTSSTESTAEEFKRNDCAVQEEPNLLTMLLNVTVEYCSGNLCHALNEPEANCQCDEVCYFYRDCCYSMIEKLTQSKETGSDEIAVLIHQKVQEVENRTLMLRKDLTACVENEYNVSGFIMVCKCDVMSAASDDVIEKCETSVDMYSVHNIPVNHVVNDEVEGTFKNVYCALCNGVPENETVFWEVDITCAAENVEAISQMAIEEIEKLNECTMELKSRFKGDLRKCYIGENYIDTCDKLHNNEVVSLCETYVYPGTDGETNKWPIYKNPHCASCHDETVDVGNFHCVNLYLSDQRNKPGFIERPVNLQVVFDFSPGNGLVSKVKCVDLVNCKFYEIYDCASKRCRQLYCQRGEAPYEGKCVVIPGVTSGGTGSLDVVTFKPNDKSYDVMKVSESYILEISLGKEASLVLYAMGETGENILKTIQDTIQSIYQKELEISQMQECPCLKITNMTEKYDLSIEIFQRLILYFERIEANKKRGYSLIPSYVKIRNFHSLESLECSNGKLIIDSNPTLVTANSSVSSTTISNMSFFLPAYGIAVYEENTLWEIGYNNSYGVVPKVVATCDNRPDLNCSMVAYEINEVKISNTSVEVINTSLIFHEDEFAIFQNKVFICADRVTETESFVNIFMFSAYHKVLSVVTSAISAFSAAIVVAAHCCLKRLRNIHGLNLSALSVSTALVHLLLISAEFITSGTICIVYAAVLHFIILNVFVWMNVIGFDMTCSLTSDKLVSQSSPHKKFLGYLLLSLAIPTLIITVAVSLDFTDSGFKPNYGFNHVCWLSNGKSILMFVIAPVVISLLLNFVLFTFTIKAIYSKAKESKFARNRSYFVVYLKLSLILGLTWVVGIVSALAEQEWLWVVHIVLNGLQGLSLLVCSLVNVRILRQLRNSMKSSNENSYSKSGVTDNSNI